MGLQVFKRLFLAFCLLLFCLSGYAAIYIVEPVDREFSPFDSDVLSFGKVARGETLRVIVQKKSGSGEDWAGFLLYSDFLPDGWSYETVETDKTFIASVFIPSNAEISTQRLKFSTFSSLRHIPSESFFATVTVKESLLDATIESLNKEAVLAQQASFSLVLNNNSIAGHSVLVESDLPNYWFESMEVWLEPNETKQVDLPVMPHSYGEKNFSFKVSSQLNAESFEFPAKMDVKPTLLGMFQSGLSGFPFFSIALLPYYLINGFLSIF